MNNKTAFSGLCAALCFLFLAFQPTIAEAGLDTCTSDADCTDPSKPKCNQSTSMCEALPVNCTSDIDCTDPSFPICDLLTGQCMAQPVAALTGTIVDRFDGSTPVHRVTVRLLNAITGMDLGITTNTNPAGEYAFSGLAPGNYKVLFDAVDSASIYVDELYNGVECDDSLCDSAVLGDTVTLSAGANLLNYSLSIGYTLSGVVLNDQAEFLENAILEIYDDSGVLVDNPSTNAQGEWSKARIRIGTYYVRVNRDSVPGYIAEVFDDIPCSSCDAHTTGTPIPITNADNVNINFVLDPVPEEVFEDGFESLPP